MDFSPGGFCKLRDFGKQCFTHVHDLHQISYKTTSKIPLSPRKGRFAFEQVLPQSEAHLVTQYPHPDPQVLE